MKLAIRFFVVFLFVFVSGLITSKFNIVNASYDVCNPACGAGQVCDCPEGSYDWTNGHCMVQSQCMNVPAGQEPCDHTICPIGYVCNRSSSVSFCEPRSADATSKPTGYSCPPGTIHTCGTPAVMKCVNTQADCTFPKWFTGWQTGDEVPNCQQSYPNTGPGKQFCQTNCACVAPTTPRPTTPSPRPVTPVPATASPSPTPMTTAQCVNTKVYTNGWVELTPEAFKGLSAGIQVYYCVNGVTNSNIFDAGRFTINGVMRAETTVKRPNSNDFCDLYTIPANTYTFKIQGELHHTVLGWL